MDDSKRPPTGTVTGPNQPLQQTGSSENYRTFQRELEHLFQETEKHLQLDGQPDPHRSEHRRSRSSRPRTNGHSTASSISGAPARTTDKYTLAGADNQGHLPLESNSLATAPPMATNSGLYLDSPVDEGSLADDLSLDEGIAPPPTKYAFGNSGLPVRGAFGVASTGSLSGGVGGGARRRAQSSGRPSSTTSSIFGGETTYEGGVGYPPMMPVQMVPMHTYAPQHNEVEIFQRIEHLRTTLEQYRQSNKQNLRTHLHSLVNRLNSQLLELENRLNNNYANSHQISLNHTMEFRRKIKKDLRDFKGDMDHWCKNETLRLTEIEHKVNEREALAQQTLAQLQLQQQPISPASQQYPALFPPTTSSPSSMAQTLQLQQQLMSDRQEILSLKLNLERLLREDAAQKEEMRHELEHLRNEIRQIQYQNSGDQAVISQQEYEEMKSELKRLATITSSPNRTGMSPRSSGGKDGHALVTRHEFDHLQSLFHRLEHSVQTQIVEFQHAQLSSESYRARVEEEFKTVNERVEELKERHQSTTVSNTSSPSGNKKPTAPSTPQSSNTLQTAPHHHNRISPRQSLDAPLNAMNAAPETSNSSALLPRLSNLEHLFEQHVSSFHSLVTNVEGIEERLGVNDVELEQITRQLETHHQQLTRGAEQMQVLREDVKSKSSAISINTSGSLTPTATLTPSPRAGDAALTEVRSLLSALADDVGGMTDKFHHLQLETTDKTARVETHIDHIREELEQVQSTSRDQQASLTQVINQLKDSIELASEFRTKLTNQQTEFKDMLHEELVHSSENVADLEHRMTDLLDNLERDREARDQAFTSMQEELKQLNGKYDQLKKLSGASASATPSTSTSTPPSSSATLDEFETKLSHLKTQLDHVAQVFQDYEAFATGELSKHDGWLLQHESILRGIGANSQHGVGREDLRVTDDEDEQSQSGTISGRMSQSEDPLDQVSLDFPSRSPSALDAYVPNATAALSGTLAVNIPTTRPGSAQSQLSTTSVHPAASRFQSRAPSSMGMLAQSFDAKEHGKGHPNPLGMSFEGSSDETTFAQRLHISPRSIEAKRQEMDRMAAEDERAALISKSRESSPKAAAATKPTSTTSSAKPSTMDLDKMPFQSPKNIPKAKQSTAKSSLPPIQPTDPSKEAPVAPKPEPAPAGEVEEELEEESYDPDFESPTPSPNGATKEAASLAAEGLPKSNQPPTTTAQPETPTTPNVKSAVTSPITSPAATTPSSTTTTAVAAPPTPAPAPARVFKPSVTNQCNTADQFRQLRAELRAYGVQNVIQDQLVAGWFTSTESSTTSTTTTNTIEISSTDKPFNPFARLVTGKMVPPYSNLLQSHSLHREDESFFVACNRPEFDAEWNSSDEKFVGKASMSQRHQFMLIRQLHWSTFNVATFGMLKEENPSQEDTKLALIQALNLLRDMESAAKKYTSAAGWSDKLGLYFHAYPFNSVQALHLHMVDLEKIGPTYHHLNYKNLPLADVRDVLLEELEDIDADAAMDIMDELGELQQSATVQDVDDHDHPRESKENDRDAIEDEIDEDLDDEPIASDEDVDDSKSTKLAATMLSPNSTLRQQLRKEIELKPLELTLACAELPFNNSAVLVSECIHRSDSDAEEWVRRGWTEVIKRSKEPKYEKSIGVTLQPTSSGAQELKFELFEISSSAPARLMASVHCMLDEIALEIGSSNGDELSYPWSGFVDELPLGQTPSLSLHVRLSTTPLDDSVSHTPRYASSNVNSPNASMNMKDSQASPLLTSASPKAVSSPTAAVTASSVGMAQSPQPLTASAAPRVILLARLTHLPLDESGHNKPLLALFIQDSIVSPNAVSRDSTAPPTRFTFVCQSEWLEDVSDAEFQQPLGFEYTPGHILKLNVYDAKSLNISDDDRLGSVYIRQDDLYDGALESYNQSDEDDQTVHELTFYLSHEDPIKNERLKDIELIIETQLHVDEEGEEELEDELAQEAEEEQPPPADDLKAPQPTRLASPTANRTTSSSAGDRTPLASQNVSHTSTVVADDEAYEQEEANTTLDTDDTLSPHSHQRYAAKLREKQLLQPPVDRAPQSSASPIAYDHSVRISIGCKGLPVTKSSGSCDPIVAAFIQRSQGAEFEYVNQTEWQHHSVDPEFQDQITFVHTPFQNQLMRFSVYDVSSESVSDEERIGSVLVKIDDIFLSASLSDSGIGPNGLNDVETQEALLDGVGNEMVYQLIHDNPIKNAALAGATICIRYEWSSLQGDIIATAQQRPAPHHQTLLGADGLPLDSAHLESFRSYSSLTDEETDDGLARRRRAAEYASQSESGTTAGEEDEEDDADDYGSDGDTDGGSSSRGSHKSQQQQLNRSSGGLSRSSGHGLLHQPHHANLEVSGHGRRMLEPIRDSPANKSLNTSSASSTPTSAHRSGPSPRHNIDALLTNIANERFDDDENSSDHDDDDDDEDADHTSPPKHDGSHATTRPESYDEDEIEEDIEEYDD